jgi:hypothetical protein
MSGHPLRLRVGIAVFGAIVAHILEIVVFAYAYRISVDTRDAGQLIGPFGAPSREFAYFSSVVYTSLGFGDIVPTGGLRFLASGEVLTGLVLIAWTASFIYLVMLRYWED